MGEGDSGGGLVQDLIPESFGLDKLFSRPVIVAVLMVLVLGPLTARRSMASLGRWDRSGTGLESVWTNGLQAPTPLYAAGCLQCCGI